MIMPEIKRVVNFEAFKGKTIQEVMEKGLYLRFVFTDGTFADLEAEANTSAKIVIEKGKQRRRTPYH
jgi:hypothetical protein